MVHYTPAIRLPGFLQPLHIALIFFGPKRLPELGSSLGKSLREFRKSTHHDEDEDNTVEPTTPILPSAQHSPYSATLSAPPSSGADAVPTSRSERSTQP
jgi:sec-independent protein translocase protein TatA